MLPAGASTRGRSPTVRLLAGLAITLSAVGLYSGYTVIQLRGLEHLQGAIIDRNRADSLLLLRIQNNLNSLGLAMRDMLDGSEPYPLTAWQAQFRRIRTDLEDALARETRYAPLDRDAEQSKYLAASMTQFWDALDRIFGLAQKGQEAEARTLIRLSLQARQEALSTAVARSALAVRWVAARGGSDLFVEAAARAPADEEGPELLVLAHLVEPVGAAPGGAIRPPAVDDSWVVVVVGDGRGGVAGIGRAALPLRRAGGDRRPPARLALGALRERLAGPARAAEGLAGATGAEPAGAVVLPFRR